MSFLDSVKSTAQRGKESVGRKSREAQLKMQLNDIAKQRKEFAAMLGESLYEEVKENPELTHGREQLLQNIQRLDEQRQAIEDEMASLEAAAAAAAVSRRLVLNCPQCGTQLTENDVFCCGCGANVTEYIASQKALMEQQVQMENASKAGGAKFCMSCGAPLGEGQQFCMNCGTRVEVTRVSLTPASGQTYGQPTVASAAEDTVPASSYGAPIPEPAPAEMPAADGASADPAAYSPYGIPMAETPAADDDKEPAPYSPYGVPASQATMPQAAPAYAQSVSANQQPVQNEPVPMAAPVAQPASNGIPVAQPVAQEIPVAQPVAQEIPVAQPVSADIPVAQPVQVNPGEGDQASQ